MATKKDLTNYQQLLIRQCKTGKRDLKFFRKIIHKYWRFGDDKETTDRVLLNQLIEINEDYNPNQRDEFTKFQECTVDKFHTVVKGLDTEERESWFGKVDYPSNIIHLMINWYAGEIRYMNVSDFPNFSTPTKIKNK